MTPRAPVVILGLDCPAGLQSARLLSARGVPSIGITSRPDHPCARTRSCGRVVTADPEDLGGLAALDHVAATLDRTAVLLPCTDAGVLAVARQRAVLAKDFHVALPPLGVVELLLDKARFAEFASAHRLPVPATRVLRSRADAEAAASALRFPCVLKPSMKTAAWERGVAAKALMVRSGASLLMVYDQCVRWSPSMVVQEWIRGLDTDHYTCDCYLDSRGTPLVTFTSRKLRQWPPLVGQGCLSVEHRNDVVRDLTIRVLQAARHTGMGYLEVKQDVETGRHLIVEANVGRPTGRSAAAEGAGVEILMTMYCDLTGEPLPEARIQRFTGAKWIHLRRDLQACVRLWWTRRATVPELLRSWKGLRSFALLSARDPVPFFTDIARAARQAPRRRRSRAQALPSTEGNGNRRSHHGAPAPLPGQTTPRRGARAPGTTEQKPPPVDFEVGGVARVRVVDATPGDLATIRRSLGPAAESRSARPDIFVRLVDRLPLPELRLLDGGSVGYGPDGLYVLRSPGGPAQARLRFGKRWGASAIVCRRGLETIPGLSAMIDLVALMHGWIPLHASAWTVGGSGVIAAGWSGSGKTGALLSFLDSGARALADDRVFISRDGSCMVGLQGAIAVRDWHLAELPRLAARAGRARRVLAPLGPRLEAWVRRFTAAPRIGGGLGARCARGLVARIRRRLGVELPARSATRTGPGAAPERASPDVVILLESHHSDTYAAERIDPSDIASRLAAMILEGFLPTLRNHLLFQYAFPGGGRNGIEGAPLVVMNMLGEALEGKVGYVVRHPYPCSLRTLRQVIAPLIPAAPTVSAAGAEARGPSIPTARAPTPPERQPPPFRRWP